MESQQYYTYETDNGRNQNLHVVDADHGIFENKSESKSGHGLSPRKLINKLKSNSTKKVDPLLMRESDDFNLRPEPELMNPSQSRIRYLDPNSRDSRSGNGQYSRLSTEDMLEDISEDENSNSNFIGVEKDDKSRNGKNRDRSHKVSVKHTSLKPKSNKLASKKSSLKTVLQVSSNSERGVTAVNSKSQIELEYDLMKIKVARYQAERDAMKVKLKSEQLSSMMKDYEYYCVNGIDRKPLDSDSDNDNYYQPRPIKSSNQPFLRQSRTRGPNIDASHDLHSQMFAKLSDILPPSCVDMLEVYAEYIPTIATVREFHKAVLIWVSAMPIINFIYPVLLGLGLLIPKKSSKSWSLRSLIVAALELVVLIVYGCGVYKTICWLYTVMNGFYRMGRFFGLF